MTLARAVGHMTSLWQRHRRLFWSLHSVFALCCGIAVLYMANERYDFLPWVLAFLGITWLSTLLLATGFAQSREGPAAGFARGFTSWLMRAMYQETLFFLIPFYAYSTVVPSLGMLFVALLGVLAVLSCLDLAFDRWLQSSHLFSLLFFGSVAFAALNLIVPTLLSINPAIAALASAGVAVVSAAPLALSGRLREPSAWLSTAGAVMLIGAVALWLPQLVPPVPLRLQEATFATDINKDTLAITGELQGHVDNPGRIVLLARVFAPADVPVKVVIDWYLDGKRVRSTREISIAAHDAGFRIWDAFGTDSHPAPSGRYQVQLRTEYGRLFGSARLTLR